MLNTNFLKIMYKNNAKYHPDVIQGTKTEDAIYNQFRQTLELFLDINKFAIIYNNSNRSLPFGNYLVNLQQISTSIISNNITRKLFFTKKDFLSINFPPILQYLKQG